MQNRKRENPGAHAFGEFGSDPTSAEGRLITGLSELDNKFPGGFQAEIKTGNQVYLLTPISFFKPKQGKVVDRLMPDDKLRTGPMGSF